MDQQVVVGFVYNSKVPEAKRLVESLRATLDLAESSWISKADPLEVSDSVLLKTKVVVTAGGDGTILRVARLAAPHGIPILGINLGRVGFMTELTVAESEYKISEYLKGEHRVEVRMMLQAKILDPSNTSVPRVLVHALNDVVVSRGAVPQLLDIHVRVDGMPLTTYRADGVIVSTATGSTGYALAAGGPTLYPEAREILIQPVAAHMGMQTGLVVNEESIVELVVESESGAGLSVDSFTDAGLDCGDRVVVERSPYNAHFLRSGPPSEFYRTVTRRLGIVERQSTDK